MKHNTRRNNQTSFKNNNRYQYEFAKERDFSTPNKLNETDTNDDLARGSNLQGAFTNPLPEFNEEFGTLKSHDVKSNNKKIKARFQEDLEQNYNVELSDELLINRDNRDK